MGAIIKQEIVAHKMHWTVCYEKQIDTNGKMKDKDDEMKQNFSRLVMEIAKFTSFKN